MTTAKRTALYDEHVRLGARLVEFAGYLLPQQYTSIRDEHLAVRQSAGLFDLGHMGRLEFRGAGAFDFLQRMFTNDLTRIEPGRAQYSLLCNEQGGILDDLVVYWAPDHFLVVVNGSTHERDVAWLREHLPPDVQMDDVSDRVALIAFQGPRAQDFLPADADLASVPYFGLTECEVGGVRCLVSRTGYTGEDGFEVFPSAEDAVAVWRALRAAGEAGAVLPCGLGARDVCRLEAGLRLYGSDMDEETNPYDAGLGWTVRLAKGEFVGHAALARVKEHGPEYETFGVRCEGRVIPRHGIRVMKDDAELGSVTSGTWSFFLDAGVGMVRVKRGTVTPGTRVELDLRGQRAAGEIVEMPFHRGSVKTPASARVKA